MTSAANPETVGSALLEREPVIAALRQAVAAGKNLLLHGPAGVGKTAVLRAALSGQPRQPLFCSAATGAALYREALAAVRFPRLLPAGTISTVRCRGLLEKAFAAGAYCLVWDPAPMTSRTLANGLRDLLRFCSVPLVAAAASPHMEDVGYLSIFFSLQSERLWIPPLSATAARAFAEAEVGRIGADFDHPDAVLHEILRLAQGSPGRIRTMLEMTRQPRYRWQNQIKLHLIHLDLLTGTGMNRKP